MRYSLVTTALLFTLLAYLISNSLVVTCITSQGHAIVLKAYGGSIIKLSLINESILSFTKYLVIKLKYFISGLGVFTLTLYYENLSSYLPILTYSEVRGVRDEVVIYCLSENRTLSRVYGDSVTGNDRVAVIELASTGVLTVYTKHSVIHRVCYVPVRKDLRLTLSLRGSATFSQYAEVKLYEFKLVHDYISNDATKLMWRAELFGNANAYAPALPSLRAGHGGSNSLLRNALLIMATVVGVVFSTLLIKRIRSRS